MQRVLLSRRLGEVRATLLDDDRPIEVALTRTGEVQLLDLLCIARVQRLEPSIRAAFLDLGPLGEAFLPMNRWPAPLTEGARLVVKIVREANALDGKLPVARPLRGEEASPIEPGADDAPGPIGSVPDMAQRIVNWAVAKEPDQILADDAEILSLLKNADGAGKVIGNLGAGANVIAAEVDDAFALALAERSELDDGGSFHLVETPGGTVIDVNTGSGRGGTLLHLSVNRSAAISVPEQLRLAGIGGLVHVDFIDLKNRAEQHTVLEALDASLATHLPDAERGGWSAFGTVTLKLRKTGPSMADRLLDPVTRRLNPGSRALYALARIAQQLMPGQGPGALILDRDAARWLRENAKPLVEFCRETGHNLIVQVRKD